MYKEVQETAYPPSDKPLMVWDGKCGFCHYWIIRWKKITGDRIQYARFQECSSLFPDIPEERFKEAVRLITPSGNVYSGPAAAYRSFAYASSSPWKFLLRFYKNSRLFRSLSKLIYQWIADHRPFMYKLSVFMWGENPAKPFPFWLIYLLSIAIVILLIFLFFSL